MSFINKVMIILLLVAACIMPQEEDSIEVYILESYLPPEDQSTLVLTFFTSEDAKSKVLLDNQHELTISDEFTTDHSARLDISGLRFTGEYIPGVIIVEDNEGNVSSSETFEIDVPKEFVAPEGGGGEWTACIIGGIIYVVPSYNYVMIDKENYHGMNWEIPLLSWYSGSVLWPAGYFSVSYQHVLEAQNMNLFRVGYDHIIPIPVFEYVSAGINGFTNFNGFNGIGTELSVGLFNFYDVFTVYLRGSYNFQPSEPENDFSEISVGLFTSFFTFRL